RSALRGGFSFRDPARGAVPEGGNGRSIPGLPPACAALLAAALALPGRGYGLVPAEAAAQHVSRWIGVPRRHALLRADRCCPGVGRAASPVQATLIGHPAAALRQLRPGRLWRIGPRPEKTARQGMPWRFHMLSGAWSARET